MTNDTSCTKSDKKGPEDATLCHGVVGIFCPFRELGLDYYHIKDMCCNDSPTSAWPFTSIGGFHVELPPDGPTTSTGCTTTRAIHLRSFHHRCLPHHRRYHHCRHYYYQSPLPLTRNHTPSFRQIKSNQDTMLLCHHAITPLNNQDIISS